MTNNGAGGEALEFHHPDRLGTRLVTNNAANTSFEQSTLPFGTALPSESTGFSNQVFTSYDRSPIAGLDYAVNRTYSPGLGRFTTVDPIGMASVSLGDPQSLNQFAYTRNSPTDFVDPSGQNLDVTFFYPTNCRFNPNWETEADKWICDTGIWVISIGGGDSGDQTDGGPAHQTTAPVARTKKNCNFPTFEELSDEQKRLFANPTEYAKLSPAQRANFLNQTGVLAKNGISLGGAKLKEGGILTDRLLFEPGRALEEFKANVLAAISGGIYSSDKPIGNSHPGMSNFGVRENRTLYSQQIGFGPDGAFIDIDIGNPNNGLFGLFIHAIEVAVPGKTDPFKVGRKLGKKVTGYTCK